MRSSDDSAHDGPADIPFAGADERGLPYAHEVATTSAAQAAYFREQAARHRRDAERERMFAELAGGETGREHEARARQHESWVSQAESVAAALEGRRDRH